MTSDKNTPEIAGILGATSLWILVHIFSEMSAPVFLLGAFSIGISAALLPHTFHQPRGPRDAYILPVITTIALSTVLIFSIIHTIQSENHYLDSMTNLSENPIAEATKATELQPYDPEYHRQRATLLTSYFLDHPDTTNSQETIRQIQREYQLALSLDPFDTMNYLTAARILQSIGTVSPDNTYDLTEISWISTAIEHAPRNPELYVQRGLIFSRTHRISAALRDFETAISLKNNYWISYIYAADTAFSNNQGTTARSLLTTVIDTSGDPMYTSIAKDMLTNINPE